MFLGKTYENTEMFLGKSYENTEMFFGKSYENTGMFITRIDQFRPDHPTKNSFATF